MFARALPNAELTQRASRDPFIEPLSWNKTNHGLLPLRHVDICYNPLLTPQRGKEKKRLLDKSGFSANAPESSRSYYGYSQRASTMADANPPSHPPLRLLPGQETTQFSPMHRP